MPTRARWVAVALATVMSVLSLGCEPTMSPRLYGVAQGNGRTVVVGEGGVVVTSADLKAWTPATSGTTATLISVAFANGRFVAVGVAGTVLVSEDGATWTSGTAPSANDLTTVLWYAPSSLWISVGEAGQVATSPDGRTWTVRHTGSAWLSNVAASDTGLLAVESGASGELTSPDGIIWTRTAQPVGERCGAAWSNGTWVSVGLDSSIHRRPSSSTAWQTPASGMWTAGNSCDVAAGPGFFVIVDAAEGTLFTSTDGLSWTRRFKSVNALRGLLVVGDEVIAVGSFGEVAHAPCPGGACGSFSELQLSIPGEAPSSGAGGGSGGGSGTGLCAHWSCGSSSQCASVMGASSGTKCTFAAGQTCQQWCTANIPGNCSCR